MKEETQDDSHAVEARKEAKPVGPSSAVERKGRKEDQEYEHTEEATFVLCPWHAIDRYLYTEG